MVNRWMLFQDRFNAKLLFFASPFMEPLKSPSKVTFSIKGFSKHTWALKALVILIILLSSFTLYIVLNDARIFRNWLNGSYYTVVVDCGSTGTRVNVYEWTWKGVGHVNNRNLPVLLRSYPDNTTQSPLSKPFCQYHCIQTEPGLDKFVGNYSGISESLEALLLWAEQIVPRERHEETPIFVLGTAGLRRLPKEDSKRVLEDVESVLERHLFNYENRWIRVLSGKEEAYYGWVALNFKMGSFDNNLSSATLGLLDLGGSSLQVVMETYDTNDLHVVRSKIGSIEHQILAYSLPSFGLNEAFEHSVYLLSQKQSREIVRGKFQVKHPCIRAGYVQNYTCGYCSRLEANDQKNEIEDQRSGYAPFYLIGEPHWEKCKLLANAAATNTTSSNWTNQEVPDRCGEGSSPQSSGVKINLATVAHPKTRFHALSGFFVVSNNLNMSAKANLTKFWESGQHLCLESWAGSSSIGRNQKFGEQFCFQVPYVASLIESALCLDDVEIVFGPFDVSWTLGAALIEGEFLWSNITRKSHIRFSFSSISSIISSPILFFSLLVCLLLMVYYSQIKLPMLGRRASPGGSSLPYSAQGRRRIN